MLVECENVWECRVNALCELVKKEPGLEEQEASPACARVKQEAGGHTERGGSAAGLYADHEVKDELVLGPTVLQPPDVAFGPAVTLDNGEHIAKPTAEGSGRSPHPRPSCEDQLQRRACFVRLERLPADEVKHGNSTTLSPSVKRQNNSEIELKGLFKGCAVSELYSCDTCGEQFTQKRSFIRHIQLHSTSLHTPASTRSVNIVQNDRSSGPTVKLPKRNLFARLLNNSNGSCISDKSKSRKQFLNKGSVKRHEKINKSKNPYKCEVCPKQFSQKNNLRTHRRIHTGEKPYKCDVCQKQFSQSSHLYRHRHVHTGEKPYKCDLCQKQFKEKYQLITHEYIHKGEKQPEPYKCEVCQKQFKERRHLTRHEHIHASEKRFKCDICSRQFTYKQNLIYHIRGHMGLRVRYDSVNHICAICGARFDKRVRLLRHARGHIWPPERYEDCSLDAKHCVEPTAKENGLNPMRSPSPGASWGDKLRLRRYSVRMQPVLPDEEKHAHSKTLRTCVTRQTSHENKLKGPPEAYAASELYSCDSCGEQFARKRNLIRHIELHSSDVHTRVSAGNVPDIVIDKIRSYPTAMLATKKPSAGLIQNSNDCLKSSSNTETLVTLLENSFVPYELGYTGEKSLKCRYCIKRYYTQGTLVIHERIHTGERPYKCDICSKRFTVNSSLLSHNRVHTGEKPYECDICLMKFAQKCNLLDHRRIHTGEKPYKCEYCTKRFIQRSALVGHERIHTGHKPFKCDICLEQFLRRAQLRVHKKRIHV